MSDSTIQRDSPNRTGLIFSLSAIFGLGASYIALYHRWSKVGVLGQDADSQTHLTLLVMLSMILSLTGLVGAILSMHRMERCAENGKRAMWGLALGLICALPPLWIDCQPI
ncbi:MAG: hypothetical protein P1V97_17945 [Planctomycetota bacterium]|nr:hypothetical protein [Planctomycetota bacterium]